MQTVRHLRREITRLVAFIVLMVSVLSTARAEEISVTASLDRDRITIEDQVALTVSISGGQGSLTPELPDLPDFDVLSRGSSSRVQIVNGSMTAQKDYQYLLAPKREGLLTIAPIAVSHKGKVYQSVPIPVRVEKAVKAAGEPADLFITTEVDNASPYVGEQVVYRFKFFRRVNVSNASLGEMRFDGFQVEDLGEEVNYTAMHNGVRYQVTEIRELLFPVQSGEIRIPGVTLRCQVPEARARGANPFWGDDVFSFGVRRTRTKVLHSEPITVSARPLPEEGKPRNFSGLVGRFTLSAGLGKEEVEQGESVTLTMTVQGEGDLSAAPRPEIPRLDQFKAYDDQPTASRSTQGERVISTKVFKTALVPQQAGPNQIAEVFLWFLNPKTGRYEKAWAGPLNLKVLASSAPDRIQVVEPGRSPALKIRVKEIGRDILPIATDLRGFADERFSPLSVAPILLFVFPPVVFAASLVHKRRRDRMAADSGYVRRRRALRKARTEMRKARALAGKPDSKEFYGRLARIVQGYLGAKINLPGEARTAAELREVLSASVKDPDLLEQTHSLLQDLEYRQFAPGSQGANECGALLERAQEVIHRLEKTL